MVVVATVGWIRRTCAEVLDVYYGEVQTEPT